MTDYLSRPFRAVLFIRSNPGLRWRYSLGYCVVEMKKIACPNIPIVINGCVSHLEFATFNCQTFNPLPLWHV